MGENLDYGGNCEIIGGSGGRGGKECSESGMGDVDGIEGVGDIVVGEVDAMLITVWRRGAVQYVLLQNFWKL